MLSFLGSVIFVAVLLVAYSWYTGSQQQLREQNISTIRSMAASQASRINGEFLEYEGLLSVISATAQDRIIGNDSQDRYYWQTDFLSQESAPPDVELSPHYGISISVEHASFHAPENIARGLLEPEAKRLALLNDHFRSALLRSLNPNAANWSISRTRRALTEASIPVAWAFVSLEEGLYQVYPGHGGYDAAFDPREQSWYTSAAKERIPVWVPQSDDDDGSQIGQLLTVAQSLRNRQDEVLGVAGLDITFKTLVGGLQGHGLGDTATSYLVDDAGLVVVSTDLANTDAKRSWMESPFPNEQVRTAITNKNESGYVKSQNQLIVFNRLDSTGWYYVLQGDIDELFDVLDQ